MATKYECDRCKKIQDDPLHLVRPRDEDFSDNFHDYRLQKLRTKYELCESCLVDVVTVLNTPPTKPEGIR